MSSNMQSMDRSNTHSQTTSVRRMGEDPLLRPFLSSMFDPESYVKNIIRDGKSEECFAAVTDCMEIINEEIQRYISQHKDVLMSGMQDVASLANRYRKLSEYSKNLQLTVQRLKREMSESYELVKARTFELERIQETNSILQQVKQFLKLKQQLDTYLQNTEDKDPRSLANVAKVLYELEKLCADSSDSTPNNTKKNILHEIAFIQKQIPSIKAVTQNIRTLAQQKLLSAIQEKNQSNIAYFLQVFYHLSSLPEIVLFLIDHQLKKTIELSTDILHFDHIYEVFRMISHTNGGGGTGTTAAAATSAAAKKGSNTVMTSTGNVTIAQLRIVMKEVSHTWSSMIYEHATQLMIVQRILQKKQDPITHEKYLSVLRRNIIQLQQKGMLGNEKGAYVYLQKGQLISLFWYRLAQQLPDLLYSKYKQYPAPHFPINVNAVMVPVLPALASQSLAITSLPSTATVTTAATTTTTVPTANPQQQPQHLYIHNVVTRMYPSLYKECIDMILNLNTWMQDDESITSTSTQHALTHSEKVSGKSGHTNNNNNNNVPEITAAQFTKLLFYNEDDVDTTSFGAAAANYHHDIDDREEELLRYITDDNLGVFGSLLWSNEDIYQTATKSLSTRILKNTHSTMNHQDRVLYRKHMPKCVQGVSAYTAGMKGGGGNHNNSEIRYHDLIDAQVLLTKEEKAMFQSIDEEEDALYTLDEDEGEGEENGEGQESNEMKKSFSDKKLSLQHHQDNTMTTTTVTITKTITTTTTTTSSSSSSSSTPMATAPTSATAILHELLPSFQYLHGNYFLTFYHHCMYPINQMFPEIEGYTVALPSKRDIAIYFQSIQSEYQYLLQEGHASLFYYAHQMVFCSIQGFLQKIIPMIGKTIESVKIMTTGGGDKGANSSTGAGGSNSGSGSGMHNMLNGIGNGNFIRNKTQEMNIQVFQLLLQLEEQMGTLQTFLLKQFHDFQYLPAGSTNTTTGSIHPLVEELQEMITKAKHAIQEVAMKYILQPWIGQLSYFFVSLLLPLHKETVISLPGSTSSSSTTTAAVNTVTATNTSNTMSQLAGNIMQNLYQKHTTTGTAAGGAAGGSQGSGGGGQQVECSMAVQQLLKHLPNVLKVYILSAYPKHVLIDVSIEEIALRILQGYITISSCNRPCTEEIRLRTAKDLATLELTLATYLHPHGANPITSSSHVSACPIMLEYKAYRRLLFQEGSAIIHCSIPASLLASQTNNSNNKAIGIPPNIPAIVGLDYIPQLRPSTLLNFLMANAPGSLPIIGDLPNADLPVSIEKLLDVSNIVNAAHGGALNNPVPLSVRQLYVATVGTSKVNPNKNKANASSHHFEGWNKVVNEKQHWEMLQQCLDIFFQRIAVMEGEDKIQSRAWYEAIVDIGSQYFMK